MIGNLELVSDRARYVLIEHGVTTLYENRLGANAVVGELAVGPDAAIAYVRNRERADTLYEDGWCEGGAVLDVDRRVLLFFGGMESIYDVWERRAFLSRLRESWPGREVRWAHEGVADFAQYIGVPIESVVRPRTPVGKPAWAYPSANLATAVSVVDYPQSEPRVRLFALHPKFEELVVYGSTTILDLLEHTHDADRLVWSEPHRGGPTRSTFDPTTKIWHARPGVPRSGLHLDVQRREAHFWTAWPTAARHWVAAHWPGWTWHSWKDRFGEQLALTAGRISIEWPDSR